MVVRLLVRPDLHYSAANQQQAHTHTHRIQPGVPIKFKSEEQANKDVAVALQRRFPTSIMPLEYFNEPLMGTTVGSEVSTDPL